MWWKFKYRWKYGWDALKPTPVSDDELWEQLRRAERLDLDIEVYYTSEELRRRGYSP